MVGVWECRDVCRDVWRLSFVVRDLKGLLDRRARAYRRNAWLSLIRSKCITNLRAVGRLAS